MELAGEGGAGDDDALGEERKRGAGVAGRSPARSEKTTGCSWLEGLALPLSMAPGPADRKETSGRERRGWRRREEGEGIGG